MRLAAFYFRLAVLPPLVAMNSALLILWQWEPWLTCLLFRFCWTFPGSETLSRLSLYRVATPGEPDDSTHVLRRKHLSLWTGRRTTPDFARLSGLIRSAKNAASGSN